MSCLICFGFWSLNSGCGKRKLFKYIKNDGKWTEIIAGRRRTCKSGTLEQKKVYYLLLFKKKRWTKEEKSVIQSIKSDTEHCWDPLLESEVTQSPIIYKILLFEELPPFFPSCPPAILLLFFLSLGTVAFMSRLISQGLDAFLRLVFTTKLMVHVCRPWSGPALLP